MTLTTVGFPLANNANTMDRGDIRKSEKFDVALDLSSVVLATLRDTARISPVPFLSQAAGVAVSIVEVVQKVQLNKTGFTRLAEDSCELVYNIITSQESSLCPEVMPNDLVNDLHHLLRTLTVIHEFAMKGSSQNVLKTFLYSGINARKIQEYRDKLQQCTIAFGLKSFVTLRRAVTNIVALQAAAASTEQYGNIFYKQSIDFVPAHRALFLLMAYLRRSGRCLNPFTKLEMVEYLGYVLKEANYGDICRLVDNCLDAENLLEYLISLLDGDAISKMDVQMARRRARCLLVKLGLSTKAVPRSLFLNSETLSLQSQVPALYSGSTYFYKGDVLGISVVLKRYHKYQLNKSFYREVLTWRTVSHPYILQFMGLYVNPSEQFFSLVSPFMDNGTLSDWRKLRNPSTSDVERRISEVAEGLLYLHNEGIVHGDLRGTNILLDSNLHVKIADYGLARHLDSTATHNCLASFHYTAPEVILLLEEEDGLVEPSLATDIYAFACLFYEIHFNCIPFATKNPFTIASRVKRGKRPERLKKPALCDQAWALITKCWDQEPDKRPCMAAVVHIMKWWQIHHLS